MSCLYASGVVASRETKLLTRENYKKLMLADSYKTLKAMLFETPFFWSAVGLQKLPMGELLQNEQKSLARFIRTSAPTENFKEVVLRFIDFDNLILALKGKMCGVEAGSLIVVEGFLGIDKINDALNSRNFESLGCERYKQVVDKFILLTNSGESGETIDLELTKIKFETLLNVAKSKVMKNFVKAVLDVSNLQVLSRGLDFKESKTHFLPYGLLDENALEKVNKGGGVDVTAYKPLAKCFESGNFDGFYSKSLTAILEVVKENANDIETEAPFLTFVIKRHFEIKNVALLLNVKKNNMSVNMSKLFLGGEA